MKNQTARRLNSYTPRSVGFLGLSSVEPIAALVHRRAVNNRGDRCSTTAVFVDRGSLVFAFCSDSLTADVWMRDRIDQLLAVIDPGRPDYSLGWLQATLRAHLEGDGA
ncbi:MAG TPA: hypothetical protein DCM32_00225 [Xanthomonadaceae bacterium]|nr:hypothetical protein [Xanthomonadaceae bacterium]